MVARKDLKRFHTPGYRLILVLSNRPGVSFFISVSFIRKFSLVLIFVFVFFAVGQLIQFMQFETDLSSIAVQQNNKNQASEFFSNLNNLEKNINQLENIYSKMSIMRFQEFTEKQLYLSRLFKIHLPWVDAQGGAGNESRYHTGAKKTFPLKRHNLVVQAFVKDLSLFIETYSIWYQYYPHLWPLRGDPEYITSPFGYRIEPTGNNKGRTGFHSGIDLRARRGSRVIATAGGTVHIAKSKTFGYGKRIRIVHDTGFETLYAHLSRINIKENDRVMPGQVIGFVGSSGNSTGPHLHYEVRFNGKKKDPALFINQ